MLDTPVSAKAPPKGLTEAMHAWITSVSGGVDPRSFPATAAAPAAPPPPPAATAPTAPPPSAPAAAAPPAPPPMTPAEAKADFERRYKNKALYDKYGQAVADDMLPEKDRLTPAEVKVGTVVRDGSTSTTIDERGYTRKTTDTVSAAVLGPDGKPVEYTRDKSTTTNVGLGNVTRTETDRQSLVRGDGSAAVTTSKTVGVDAVKGEGTIARSTTTETKDATGKTTTVADKTTATVGMSGVTGTVDHSTQVGKQLDSTSTTAGITRTPGQLGASIGQTKKSGTMTGPADQQVMDKGTETTRKATAGVVSDDKGVGIGANASQNRKTLFGDGKAITTAVTAGLKSQSLVKEIPGSEPPRFTITTTITFDLSLGATGSKEFAPRPGADDPKGGTTKASVSIGASVSGSASASFKHELSAEDAEKYVEDLMQNGRGSKLPEHQILATGASQGVAAAKQMWERLTHSVEQVKALKPGEELETNIQGTASGKAGTSGGETRQGGLAIGGEASVTGTHRINIKKTGMPDGKILITATIENSHEEAASGTASMGMAGMKAGASHGEGTGRVLVFLLDPKDPAFDGQLKIIDAAKSETELDRIAAENSKLVVSKTVKDNASDGSSAGGSIGPVSLDLAGKGTIANEVTRDGQGNVIGSKSTGTSTTGGTFGVGDLKVGDSKTETYVGEVGRDGKAKGEISDSEKHTSFTKTLTNIGNIGKDPLGTIMNPGKLLADEQQTSGIAVADAETMAIVSEALNKTKWNSKVGGHRMDEWKATGDKIRAAVTLKDGQIVKVDKTAVQRALAEWTKADDGGRTEVLDSIIRPLGGIPTGKAFAFPDGLDSLKGAWDSLVIADPLEGARAKLAAKDFQGALTDMQNVKKLVSSLYASVKSGANKWQEAGLDMQHAEMLGHINTRMNEIDKAIHDVARSIPAPPKPNAPTPKPEIGPPTAEQDAMAKEEEARQRAIDAKADLETYNNNIETMKGYAETVFSKLGAAEAKLNDRGLFSGSDLSHLIEVNPWVKQAEDLIKIWDALYWPTYKIYEKWSPMLNLDKSRLEKLHVAGAKAKWKQVYDMTRDTSMVGRG